MINIETSFTKFSYRSPLPVRGLTINYNRFLKVRILELEYYISVLPGLHQASLEEINFKVKIFFNSYKLNFDNINFDTKFFNLIHIQDTFLESIKDECLFNIEAILLGLIKKSHPHLISNNAIAINQLYNDKDGVHSYLSTKCLKIKINSNDAQKTVQLINELDQLNPEMIYRLDGNKKFELNELIKFESLLKNGISPHSFLKIDYIEEPFKNFYDTFLFKKRSKLPIAIDESFKNYMKSNKTISPAVIRPSLIGISPIMFWLKAHKSKRAIISSSFEHPSISEALFFLANQRSEEFHGLENFISLPK